MIEINLLRFARERKADVRQYALMLGGTVLGSVLLAMAVHAKLIADASEASGAMVELQQQIDQFKPQLEQVERYRATKQSIESKLEVIDHLERSRSGPVHVLDELAHRPSTGSPGSARRGDVVKGMSLDNELVALFMTPGAAVRKTSSCRKPGQGRDGSG
jgi:type IV pilus assembly protein PilN